MSCPPRPLYVSLLNSHGASGNTSSDSSLPATEILSLCKHGHLDSAIHILSRLPFPLPETACICLLKACVRTKTLHHARKIFAHVLSHKVQLSGLLGDYLVIAFAKCGGMHDALKAFSFLVTPTLFAWSALISGYAASGQGKEAIRTYFLMIHHDFVPDCHVYVSLFKACGSVQDFDQGKKLHDEVRRKGLMANVFIGNSILSMYGKCGTIQEAELVFSELYERNIVSWNSMLSGYVEQGEVAKTLLLYRQMQAEGVEPNELTFIMAIQACCLQGAIPQQKLDGGNSLVVGQALHCDVSRKGFLSHAIVASTLMCMYGKHGDIQNVEGVFTHVCQHNLVTWTTMLKGYVQQRKGRKALMLYGEMCKQGMSLDEKAFVLFFQACCILAEEEDVTIVNGQTLKLRSLEIGRALHEDAKKKDVALSTFAGGSIVCMYGKCGSIADAETVFMALPQQDVVTWNVMLSAYVDQGHAEKALHLYRKMIEAGIVLDERSVVCTLQACVVFLENNLETPSDKEMCLEVGKNLHFDVTRDGFDSNSYIGNTLINLYGKCQCILEAEYVFELLPKCNIATWNVMLCTYIEQGRPDQCLLLYRQMQAEGVNPDERTFVITLQAYSGMIDHADTDIGPCMHEPVSPNIVIALHADARRRGFASHIFVGNSLMTVYAKTNAIERAEDVFLSLEGPNVVSWNVLLAAYVDQGQAEKALKLYAHMHDKRKIPDPRTFATAFQACCILKGNDVIANQSNSFPFLIAQALYSDAQRKGFISHLFVGNSILSMYGKFGKFSIAEEVFNELYHRNVVSWNAILTSYVEHGKGDRALLLYKKMQDDGVAPNDVTLVCVLQACGETGNRDTCNEINFISISAGLDVSAFVATTLIHAYGSCASIADSKSVFNEMSHTDVESWNAILTAYAEEGNYRASLSLVQDMLCSGVWPSKVSFFSFLCACSYTGFVENGLMCFLSMMEEFDLVPELKHYVILVDILGRAGDFLKVERMLAKMSLQPDIAFWLCLMGACRIHGNVQFGEQVYNLASHQQPEEAAVYVSMSNIYAEAGMF